MADIINNDKKALDENGYYLDVGDYYDKIHHTTWARRTSGMMAGATLGVAYGIAIGAAAFFIPSLLALIPALGVVAPVLSWSAFGTTVAAFAASTGVLGIAVNTDVSVNAASTAAGMEEKELREKEEGRFSAAGLSNGHATHKRKVPGTPPMFNWKIAAFCAPLFAAFGVLIAPMIATTLFQNAPVFSGLITETASIVKSTGVSIGAYVACGAIMGMFGSLLGFRNSDISNRLSNFYYRMVTGQIFNKSPAPHIDQQPQQQTQVTVSNEKTLAPALPEMDQPQYEKKFANEKLRFSLNEILEKTGERGIAPGR